MASFFWCTGGDGAWNTSTSSCNWGLASGVRQTAPSGNLIPGVGDDVFFDGNSGAGSVTFNTNTISVHSWDSSAAGALTFSGNKAVTIGGAGTLTTAAVFKFGSGQSFSTSASGGITFDNRSGGLTVTMAGVSLSGVTGGIGTGASSTGGVTFTDSINIGSNIANPIRGTWKHNSGTTLTCGTFSISGTGAKTIDYTGATITCSTAWTAGGTLSAITITGNSSSNINISSGGTFTGGGKSYPGTVTFTAGDDTIADGGNTFTNLTVNGSAGLESFFNTLQVAGDQTVSGVLMLAGNAQNARLEVVSTVVGTNRTFTVNGSFSLSNVDFLNITAAGSAGGWTGTSIGDRHGNTNITFTSPVTVYWVGATTLNFGSANVWASSSGGSGGSAGYPLPQDTAIFDSVGIPSSGFTVNTATGALPKINASGVSAANFTLSINGKTVTQVCDDVTLSSTTTLSIPGTNSTLAFYKPSATINLTMNGGSFSTSTTQANNSIIYSNVSSMDGATFSNFPLQVNSGATFDISAGYVTMGSLNTNGSGAVALGQCSYTFTSRLANQQVFNCNSAGGSVTNSSKAEFIVTNPANQNLFFNCQQNAGTALTLGALIVQASTGTLNLQGGSCTITTLAMAGNSKVSFLASATYTVSAIEAVGSSGNLVTITSSSAGTAFTFSCAAGNVICDWLSLKDCTAAGGATFYQGANTTVVSGVTGWTSGSGPYNPQVIQ